LPTASTGGTGKAGIAPHVDDDRHRVGTAPGIKGIWEIECLPSSMRKPARHVECCAVLGPRSQGETALSPAGFVNQAPPQTQEEPAPGTAKAVFPRTLAAFFRNKLITVQQTNQSVHHKFVRIGPAPFRGDDAR